MQGKSRKSCKYGKGEAETSPGSRSSWFWRYSTAYVMWWSHRSCSPSRRYEVHGERRSRILLGLGLHYRITHVLLCRFTKLMPYLPCLQTRQMYANHNALRSNNKSSITNITMTFDTNIMLLWFIPHLPLNIATTNVSMVAVRTSEVGATLLQISALFGNIFESNVASNW
jgi:hypothetical protein